MTIHAIKRGTTTLHTVDVPSSSDYTQPASDSASTAALRRGSNVIFRVNNADGLGTTKSIGGKTFYSKYRTVLFESDYICGVGSNVNDIGYGTTAYGSAHNFGSTNDSQNINVPGSTDAFSIEGIMKYLGEGANIGTTYLTFAVTPDEETELGSDTWDDYTFTLIGNSNTIVLDGGRMTALFDNAPWEQWRVQDLSASEQTTIGLIFQNNTAFSMKIQRT